MPIASAPEGMIIKLVDEMSPGASVNRTLITASGAMAYQYYRKNIVVAIAPLAVMSVLFTLVPGLISSTSFMIIPSGALAIGIAYTIYKKKKASKEAQV